MSQPPPPTHCGYHTGVIFVRPCQGTPITACTQCGIPLCVAHRRAGGNQVLCPRCDARLRQDDSDTLFDSDRPRYRSSSTYSGGTTGAEREPTEETAARDAAATDGAGYGPEAAGVDSADFGESPFSEEDYAAFDAVSDYDRSDEKGGGYDS